MFLLDATIPQIPTQIDRTANDLAGMTAAQTRRFADDLQAEANRQIRPTSSSPPGQNVFNQLTSFLRPILAEIRIQQRNLFQIALDYRNQLPSEQETKVNDTLKPLMSPRYSNIIGMLSLFSRETEVVQRLKRGLRAHLDQSNYSRIQNPSIQNIPRVA